ncbi:MAG: tetratricopeptide repeat protein [Acidobacteriota bacterium]
MRLLQEIRSRLGNYHIKSGLFHYYRGEYSQALDYFHKAMESGNLSAGDEGIARYYIAQSHISEAEKLEEDGESARAVEEYQRAIQGHPAYPDLHFRLACLQQATGDLAQAAASLEMAIRTNPDYFEAHLSLAFVLLESGDTEGADAAFQKVRELAIFAVTEPHDRGRAALAAGNLAEAVEFFKEAFARHPHRFDYHYKRGLKLMRRARYEEAIDHLRQAIAFNPKFADVYNYLGVALVENGDLEAGEQALRRSVELNPDYMVAQMNLGFTLARLGRPREAGEQLRFVLDKEPDNQAVRSRLEELEQEAGAEKKRNGEGVARHGD